jgi:phage terminase Nu1 subunit (DNA packaging protein)
VTDSIPRIRHYCSRIQDSTAPAHAKIGDAGLRQYTHTHTYTYAYTHTAAEQAGGTELKQVTALANLVAAGFRQYRESRIFQIFYY